MDLKQLFLGLLIAGLLFGCSEQDNASENSEGGVVKSSLPDFSSIKTDNIFVYNCGDSLEFTAHISNDSTWLFLPDTSLKVTSVPSGSGVRYEGSAYLFWSKEQEAILQKPRGSLLICQVIPQERSWEAAKLRGVDFRALGQEPGWYLEITDGEQIQYVGNYGQDTLVTPVPDPKKQQERTLYKAETEDQELIVEIMDEPCADSMSGFHFPKTVSVSINGDTYHGCGRALN